MTKQDWWDLETDHSEYEGQDIHGALWVVNHNIVELGKLLEKFIKRVGVSAQELTPSKDVPGESHGPSKVARAWLDKPGLKWERSYRGTSVYSSPSKSIKKDMVYIIDEKKMK